ncbi:class I SAM-dependent rRNA methyltransferase [bacterium]|nr:class I SAM-dependent rRNA methyltransferase [bacterium]
MKPITLKPEQERRIQNGHLWIFSNEIMSNLKDYEPGELVEIRNSEQAFIGIGYVNPHSLIGVRLLTRQIEEIDYTFFEKRIVAAHNKRLFDYPDSKSFRLVFGESDGLPGLVVDKYEDFLVVQSTAFGIEKHLDVIYEVLKNLFNPKAIVARLDTQVRQLEHLEIKKEVVFGQLPPVVNVNIEGLTYKLDLLHGQKTGFFLDQKENHTSTAKYVKDKKVLDCFCYVGGWSLNAARFGASSVIGLDKSEQAITQCLDNTELNHIQNCTFKQADVFDEFKNINEQKEKFDVIILDPPAFAKSRAHIKDAIKGYREINRRAAKALTDGGILYTCSCSHVIDPETFRNVVFQGLYGAGKNAILLENRMQSKDHPVLLSMRETEYLKCLVLQVF